MFHIYDVRCQRVKNPNGVFKHACMCRNNVVMISRVAVFSFNVGYFLFWECLPAKWVFLKFDIGEFCEKLTSHFNFHLD
jgi:hypothetical protein